MSDVTAQAFREAAAKFDMLMDQDTAALLLAAAEQREQLEAIEKSVAEYRLGLEHNPKQISRKEIPMILAALDQQIATLTDEVDMVRRAYETVQDNEFAALSPSTHAQNLAQQVRTLTAERDEARQLVHTLGNQAEQFRRERDDALGRIANALI
jgi:predicted  nucleic acid-binding Zn-ribbon protein